MPIITRAQAVAFAQAAGFADPYACDTIVAIAQAESGLNTDALSPYNQDSHTYPDGTTHASRDRGILQINDYWWASYSDACVYDPACAFKAGYTISKQGTDFSDWSTYQSGAYRKYLTMNLLPNFPLVNQLSEPTSDGQTDENAQNNCVVASIAAGLEYLLGRSFNGDQLKDAVYGQGYTGPMAASHFVGYLQNSLGIHLYSVSGTQAELVSALHANIQAGRPVLVTMPSQWGTAPADPTNPSGSTHVGIACGEGPGVIRVMNPWGGFWQDQSDAWWQARLCYGQVWPMEKMNVATVPSGWTDNGTLLKAPNGITVGTGFRNYILTHPWNPGEWPVGPEQTVAQVMFAPDGSGWGGGSVQYFQHSCLTWSRSRDTIFLQQVGLDAFYMRGMIGQLQQSVSAAQVQNSALQSQLSAANATAAQAKSDLSAAQSQVSSLTAQVADLSAKLAAATGSQATPAQLDAVAALQSLKKAMGEV